MQKSFLSQLAEKMVASGVSLKDTAVILPNKRAHRMLLKELAALSPVPVFAPTVFTINDFVSFLSPLEQWEKMALMVELYQIYRELAGSDADDFSTALSWMPAFIDDVSETDKQMDDAVRILTELAYAKDFEIPFTHDTISAESERKIRFFKMLADLYVKFKESLLAKGAAYDGLVYRDCAEHIDEYQSKLSFKHFVFAGFHVLNPAELAVVKFVKEHFDTQFYFDIDPFYCDFNKNERFTTAHFLHKICQTLSLKQEDVLFQEKSYETIEKNIRVVGTSKEMNQIFYAIKCLEDIQKEQGNLDNTALVLADEKLLVPLLSAYDISDANVTMGYPFAATPAYTLLETLLEMYQTAFGYRSRGFRFHRRNVLAFLLCPLIKNYLFDNKSTAEQLIGRVESEKRALYGPEDLKDFPLPEGCFEPKDLLNSIIAYIRHIEDKMLARNSEDNKDVALLQMLLDNLEIVQQQLQPLTEMGIPLTLSIIKYAIYQQMGGLTLPIKGDATRGLQIMGLLETRTLDFKNVILLSANEGVLPSGIGFNSIIPFDFKFQGETLENYLYKDQVYAYHFFRLLQRAENVVLMYNNNCTGSLVEKSRFITQLEFEVRERGLTNIHIEYPAVSFPYQSSAPETLSVKKTDEILQILYNYKYSASALKTYINCPLQFYLKHVCHIQPPTTFQERIESNVIGTVVHAAFEKVFDVSEEEHPDFNQRIDDYLTHLEENLRHLILEDPEMQDALHLQEKDLDHGRVYLAYRMVCNDVRNYLQRAKSELQGVTIVGNEIELSCVLPVGEHVLQLRGFIDRLQKQNGHLVVVDYKTGRVDDTSLKVAMSDVETVFSDPKYEKFIQLLFYALLCKYSNNETVKIHLGDMPVQCEIISIPDANMGKQYIHKAVLAKDRNRSGLINPTEFFEEEHLEHLEKSLIELLSNIIDQKKDFVQTSDANRCGWCDFKHLCGR